MQHPTPSTLTALADALATSEEELTGTLTIRPDDPLLENLTEEDLQVAQAFHHAPTKLKQRTLQVLRERGRGVTDPDLARLEAALLEIRPAQRTEVVNLVLSTIGVKVFDNPTPDVSPGKVADTRREKRR